MARLIAFNAIFFLLPFAVYAGWLAVTRGAVNNPAYWPLRTIVYLTIGGAAVMIAGLLVFIHFSSAPPGASYRPAVLDREGRIVPGTLE
jgi:hypothetical protein